MEIQSKPSYEKLDIRRVQESDIPLLTDLFRNVFHIERDESFWRWKYFSNPAGNPFMAVAEDHDRRGLAGQVGVIPVYLAYRGEKTLGSQVCDIVILPEYQKGGLFFKLHDLATKMVIENEVQFLYAFSVPTTFKISIRLLKFQNVFPIHRFIKILNPSYLVLRSIQSSRLKSALGNLSGEFLRKLNSSPVRPPEGYRISEVSFFDGRYDTLMQSLTANSRIMVYKDSQYLNWRYTHCPLFRYKAFAVENDEEVLGFTVVSIQEEDVRRAYIMELLSNFQKREVLEVLLDQALRYSYMSKAITVNAWATEHSAAWNIQREKRFKVKETAHNLIARRHFKKGEHLDVLLPSSWDISLGDSDYH